VLRKLHQQAFAAEGEASGKPDDPVHVVDDTGKV